MKEIKRYKKRGDNGSVTVTISGKDKVMALEEIMSLTSIDYNVKTYTDAVNFLIKRYIDDKIVI